MIGTGGTHRPAANTLLLLLLFTSMAVTGPGRALPSPRDDQVLLENVYAATFAWVLSARAIDPAAMRESL